MLLLGRLVLATGALEPDLADTTPQRCCICRYALSQQLRITDAYFFQHVVLMTRHRKTCPSHTSCDTSVGLLIRQQTGRSGVLIPVQQDVFRFAKTRLGLGPTQRPSQRAPGG
jgi:hypothetical protein